MRDRRRPAEAKGHRALLAFICGGLAAAAGSAWAVRARRGSGEMGEPRTAAGTPNNADGATAPSPALAGKADDLEALRAAVVDAAGVSAGLWLSYLFVLFYLLVAAAGVTHQILFFANPVKLPFLNVDLPLEGFFWLGPALFLVVHAYVLLHFVLLAGKVAAFNAQLRVQIEDADVRTRLRRQLPSNIFVQVLAGPREVRDGVMGLLLWLIALVTLAIGPAALLVFFQLQFLPYHHEEITWWQRIAVAIDLWLLWVLWRRIGLREATLTDEGGTRRRWPVVLQRVGTALAVPLLALVSVPLVFAVATFPGEWLERTLPSIPLRGLLVAGDVDFQARKPTSLWSNRLVLPSLDVIDRTKFDSEAKISALTETASLRKRRLEGAVLIDAVLRKADFTGAKLQGAELDRTRLEDARLDGARLQGASLNGARLQGASLDGAQLEGASLDGALLQGASLRRARLQGASLEDAQLEGAPLDSLQLQGARLDGARLQGASLEGAFVWRAGAEGADLTNTLVADLAIEPKQPCAGASRTICDWSAEDLQNLKQHIRITIDDDKTYAAVQAKIEPLLDPTKPLEDEEEVAERWADFQQASPERDAHEAELAEQWRRIGCASSGAPFVATKLAQRMIHALSPFANGNPRASQLAADFLGEHCAGTRGLADKDKEGLRELRDRVPRDPDRPSSEVQQP